MGLIQRARPWLQLIRPGDWLILILCIAGSLYCVIYLWPRGTPDTAVIRLRGQIIAERPLKQSETLKIQGPLGTTLIQIEPGRARIQSDPGPRQYCVKQGWLTQTGAIAICAPNEISLSLTGQNTLYDSLNY